MKAIVYKDYESGDIYFLKDLCNNLMRFQADRATIKPDVMASMNFENRLVPDFTGAERKYIAVAYDCEKPIGFAFAAVSKLKQEDISARPSWAQEISGLGFYPEDYDVPKTIGTYKLLFVDSKYRGCNIGGQHSNMIMKWLNGHEDIEDLWVFVANGNEVVGKFYEKYGFVHSHTVFKGFIEAYWQNAKRNKE
ncbi:GNAT family N-acetyltransferase [Desulfosporosinus sp. SB140]|uniref:GNAT family N-acetyltransferase n=1 Tax=Desulfosporosinus paludis TaxID=3115649 RepID=UPI00388D8C02